MAMVEAFSGHFVTFVLTALQTQMDQAWEQLD